MTTQLNITIDEPSLNSELANLPFQREITVSYLKQLTEARLSACAPGRAPDTCPLAGRAPAQCTGIASDDEAAVQSPRKRARSPELSSGAHEFEPGTTRARRLAEAAAAHKAATTAAVTAAAAAAAAAAIAESVVGAFDDVSRFELHGVVENIAQTGKFGFIDGNNGIRYFFHTRTGMQHPTDAPLANGQEVRFCATEDTRNLRLNAVGIHAVAPGAKPSIRSGLVLDINAETEQVSIADEKTGAVMRAAFGNISCLADMKPLSEVRYCVSERAVGSPRLLAVKRRPTVSPFREAVKAAAVRQATWATKTAGSTRQRRSGSDADKWERVQLPAVA
jgi:cold shock CspA family protein